MELVYAAENGGKIAVEAVTDQLEGMDITSVLAQVIFLGNRSYKIKEKKMFIQ